MAELKNALDVEATLVESGGGAYEITVDGDVVFSKLKLGRFPNEGEILGLLRDR